MNLAPATAGGAALPLLSALPAQCQEAVSAGRGRQHAAAGRLAPGGGTP